MRSCITIVALLFIGRAQAQSTMLVEQLSSRTIERLNYDKDGKFLNRQLFEAGQLKDVNGLYELKVVARFFNRQDSLTATYTTMYRCKPETSSVMIMAFPFSNPKSKETEINSKSSNFKELYDLEHLQDIEIELTYDSGMLNFLGSKSNIMISDRKLHPEGNRKILESTISIKTYALGIRVKSLNYSVSETLTGKNSLVRQQFTEEDGSHFTITYD